MVRVKKGKPAHKRRKHLLEYTKGFKWSRKSKYRAAREALLHAWSFSFKDRKRKKREFRKIWNIRINAFVREHGLTYSRFIYELKKKKIGLDRKVLSQLAVEKPEIFEKILEKIKG